MSRGRKFLVVLGILTALVVGAIFYFKADPVPEKNQKTYETDSSKDSTENQMVDSLIDQLSNDPEFDFDFEEEVMDSVSAE